MAIARPFTYNNGSTIPGSSQLGDLAIGNPGRYDNNPGGKVWWMGPDETGRYVIAKDVPASNWPTPVGNVGSARFWATSTENDTQFINLTNEIGGNSFSTTLESWNWLGNNGYWTNYPNPIQPETGSLWAEFRTLNAAGTTFTQNVFFLSQSERLLIGYGTQRRNTGGGGTPLVTKALYYTSSSRFNTAYTSGSFTSLNYTGTPGYQPLPGKTKYDFFDSTHVAVDYENEKLYTIFGSNESKSFLVTYNLTASSVVPSPESEVELTLGKFGSEQDFTCKVIYNSYNDRIYLPYTDQTPSPSNNEIYIYDSTNLSFLGSASYVATGSTSDIDWPQISPNSINGELVQLNSSVVPNKFTFWNFNNISSPTYEVYNPTINWRLTSPLIPTLSSGYSILTSPFPFSPTQNKFYIPGFQTGSTYSSLNGLGNAMLVLDGNTHEVDDIIYLGGQGFGTDKYMLFTVGIYDELRDYVWTFNLDNKLVIISCASNQVIGEFELEGLVLNTGGFTEDVYDIPSLALDNAGKTLFYAPGYSEISIGGLAPYGRFFDISNIIDELP